jgi:hypothetical protein
MFDEVPSARITERRDALREALIAAAGVVGGTLEAFRKGRVDWETLGWILIFITGVYAYWKKRHDDPWTPPLHDPPKGPET